MRLARFAAALLRLVPLLVAFALTMPAVRGAAQLLPSPTSVAADRADVVPDVLRPWIPWVLRDTEMMTCPLLSSVPMCMWPGRATFELTGDGGTFSLQLWADAAIDISLPGDARNWPHDVMLDGAPALMSYAFAAPRLRVERGAHVVSGRFAWDRLPEALVVPTEIALVDVNVDGAPLGRVRREASGAVWLNAAATEENEADSLTVDVWRRVVDGVPIQLETRVQLRVGGDPREVDLGNPLFAGFAAWQIDSPLPARLDEEGHLRVQLRAGEWQVAITAASTGPMPSIVAALPPEPWPAAETWTFVANDAIRSVRLGGATAIDPARTSLPGDWQGLPTFRVSSGEGLEITELRRGEPTPPPPSLYLSRRAWLDRDGHGLIVQDDLSGTLYEGGRINVASPATAGRIAVGGAGQVITTYEDANGVEVRSGALTMSADLRYDARSGDLPAVGYNQDVQNLTVALQVPPGWRLLTATGPDSADGAWLQRWTLYDLFILLVTAVVAWRLFGLLPALGLLVVVGLSWHEASSVRGLWLALLGVGAVAGALAEGRIKKLFSWARWAVAIALGLCVIAFAWTELRTGIFPHLEAGDPRWGVSEVSTSLIKAGDDMGYYAPTTAEAPPPVDYRLNDAVMAPAEPSPAMEMEGGRGEARLQAIEQVARDAFAGDGTIDSDLRNMPQQGQNFRGGLISSVSRTAQVDPDAVVQTGPGVPAWNWRQYTLTWAGPVSQDDTIRLFLIPPWADMILSFIRALGAIWLAVLFIHGRPRTRGSAPSHGPSSPAAVAALALLAVAAAASPRAAQAQEIPYSTMLDELRNVLVATPACSPNCVEVPSIDLRADAEGISFSAELHVAAASSWVLPGPDSAWIPTEVTIDGVPTNAIYRDTAGFLAVRLEPGIHRVTARGQAAASVALGFSSPVRVMTWTVDGWTLDGYRADQAPPRSVQLRRNREDGAAPTTEVGGPTGVAPRFAVSRSLDIGVPMVTHTAVARLGRTDESTVVRIPLLAGETVTTAGITVEAAEAVITFAPGVTVVEWDANLAESPTIALTAPTDVPWTESWTLLCSPVWHCTASGLVATAHMANGTWAPTFNPWPGEALSLSFVRPEPIDGSSLTVDSATLDVVAGRRIRTSTLSISMRASRGGEQAITLDAASEIRSFAVDGVSRPFELVDGNLAYTVEPGAHTVVVSWQENVEAGTVVHAPTVDLGTPAANARVTISVPDNRWVVWTGGATWGPVVRFWEFALVLLLVAFGLARYMPAPVALGAWFLLGLGMTQVDPMAPLIVVAWFAALGLRNLWRSAVPVWVHNLAQIIVVILTIYAVGALLQAVAEGLALRPPSMHVEGGGSSDSSLVWTDYSTGNVMPTPIVVWLPIWVWRATMLAWSAWLAFAVVRWARWGWNEFNDGGLWRRSPMSAKRAKHETERKAEEAAPAVAAEADAEPTSDVRVPPRVDTDTPS